MSRVKKKNTTIKILAVFISILLWSYVRNEVNPKIVREFKNIDVDIVNERLIKEEGLVISENEDLKVSVKVSGRRSDLNSIKENEISAEIDLSNATKGTQKIPIEVTVPFNIEIVDLNKRYISVELDNLNTVKKNVELRTLKSNSRQTIETSEISPSTVEISGPSRLLNQVKGVIVNVDLNNISSTGIMKLPVKAVDDKGNDIKGIEINPDIVEVTVSLKSVKKVSIKPNIVGSVAESFNLNNVSVNPKTITIRGNEEELKNIDVLQTEKIDVSGLDENKNFKAKLILPNGVLVDGGINEVVVSASISSKKKVNEENKESNEERQDEKTDETINQKETFKQTLKEIKVPIEKIIIKGTKADYKTSVLENIKEVSLSLVDNSSLTNLTAEDISLALTVEGLDEGVHDIKLEAIASKGTIKDFSPKSIQVKIEKIENKENIDIKENTENKLETE